MLKGFFTLLFVAFLASCSNHKIALAKEVINVLAVEEAFIQKEVPGIQDAKPSHYLNIRFSKESFSNQLIDKITIQGKFEIDPTEDIDAQLKYNPIKIKVNPFFINDDKSALIVKLFFTQEGKEYYQQIENVLIKEPIYLP